MTVSEEKLQKPVSSTPEEPATACLVGIKCDDCNKKDKRIKQHMVFP